MAMIRPSGHTGGYGNRPAFPTAFQPVLGVCASPRVRPSAIVHARVLLFVGSTIAVIQEGSEAAYDAGAWLFH
jgi:hypothetical protein